MNGARENDTKVRRARAQRRMVQRQRRKDGFKGKFDFNKEKGAVVVENDTTVGPSSSFVLL